MTKMNNSYASLGGGQLGFKLNLDKFNLIAVLQVGDIRA